MRAAGVIAEWDPFHNGHRRHIERTREATGCDLVVGCMNGSFSQRGEPMLLDKWTRARMALLGGADVVVELPALWGTQPAEGFARGGVETLAALGCEWLSFGCETDDLAALRSVAALLEAEPEEYHARLREGLDAGESFPRARGEALAALTGLDAELLRAPNAALAVEYLRANARLERPMTPVVVRRAVSHHETVLAPETSASAIRRAVLAGDVDAAVQAMPPEVFAFLREAAPGALPDADALDRLLLYALRGMGETVLAALPGMGEGLDRLLARAAEECTSREELLERLKSRRYTRARLSRLLVHALLGADAALMEAHPAPEYVRLIGFRRSAAPLLGKLAEACRLPFVTRAVERTEDPVFAFERRATDVRALLCRERSQRRAARDLTERIVVVEDS